MAILTKTDTSHLFALEKAMAVFSPIATFLPSTMMQLGKIEPFKGKLRTRKIAKQEVIDVVNA